MLPSTVDPVEPDHLMQLAEQATRERRLDEALALWERIRSIAPDRPGAWSRGSVPLLMAGRLDDAETLLEDGLRRFPAFAGIYFHHAEVAGFRQDWAEAEQRWRSMTAKFPTAGGGWFELGRVLERVGRQDEATDAFARAALLEPHRVHPQIAHLRGSALTL
eukprot:gene2839-3730_t